MTSSNQNVARGVPLTLSRSARPSRISRLANGVTLLFVGPLTVVRVLSVWQARSTHRRVLAELDDHLLRDIGLTRADVQRELAKPFWRP